MARQCGGCGESGHNKRTCPKLGNKPKPPRVPKGNRRCGKCGGRGHNARTCKFATRPDAQGEVDVEQLDLNSLTEHVHVSRPSPEFDLVLKNLRYYERDPAYCRPVDTDFPYEGGDFVVVKYPWYEFVIVGRITMINYATGTVLMRNIDPDMPNAQWNFKKEMRPGMKVERYARDKKYLVKETETKNVDGDRDPESTEVF